MPSWGVRINDSDMVSPSMEVLCRDQSETISPYMEVLCRGQPETIQNVNGEVHGDLHGESGLMIQTWSVPP